MQNSKSLALVAAVLPQFRELEYKQSNSNAPTFFYIMQRQKSLNSPKLILQYCNDNDFLNFPRIINDTPHIVFFINCVNQDYGLFYTL